MKKDPPLSVHIPGPDADQPSWVRVGVVAVIGFAIGVAWPRLAGVKLGPNAPGTAQQEQAAPGASASAVAKASPGGNPASPTASLVAPVPSGAAAAPATSAGNGAEPATSATGLTSVTVKPGIVIGCRTEAGEKLSGKACGVTNFDTLALPRLKKLAACPAAAGAEGRFSPQFHLDFERNKFTVQLGRKNTVENVDSLSACLGLAFEKVSINAVTHEHPRYSIQYNVEFGKAEAGAKSGAVTAANGNGASATAAPSARGDGSESKIAWDVAVVRDAPRTGQIVGRFPRGTSVQVLATDNNWYRVKSGSTEGWLYRGAIGR